jgi:hypothetical protein
MEMGIKSLHIGKSVIVPEQTALLCSVMRRNIDNASVPSPPEISDIEFAFSGRKFQDEYFTAERREEELMGEYTEADKALENLLSEVRQEYSKSERRRVAVNIYAVLEKNKKFRVAAEDHDGNRVVFLGPKSMGAKTRAINERYLETELYKTGETPYYADKVMAYAEEGLTLPENTVQEARTQIISKLSRRRAKVPEVKIGKMPGEPESKAEILETKTIVEVREREQLTRELAELKPDYIYLPLKYAHETELLRPFKEHGAIEQFRTHRTLHLSQHECSRRLGAQSLQLICAQACLRTGAYIRNGFNRTSSRSDKQASQAFGCRDYYLWQDADHDKRTVDSQSAQREDRPGYACQYVR